MRPLNLKMNAVGQSQSQSLPGDSHLLTYFYGIKDSSSVTIWKDLEAMDMQMQASKHPKHSQERFGTGPSMRKNLGDITNTNLQQLSHTDMAQVGIESPNFRYHGERVNERRERHNHLERERRKRIRSCCDELNYLVPFCTPETDKATTLQWTTGFLMYIQERYGEDIKKGFENMFRNQTAEQSRALLNKACETKLKNPAT
uniref:transcription factor-like 5 protein n=1 Tax=Myxine glutinosa TaxID=7769 RepID=UPI00358FED70